MKVIVQLQLRDAVKFGSGFSERPLKLFVSLYQTALRHLTLYTNLISFISRALKIIFFARLQQEVLTVHRYSKRINNYYLLSDMFRPE